MGNETYYYFGAYLEVKVKKMPTKETVFVCRNNHTSLRDYAFCPECGSVVSSHINIKCEYPLHLADIIDYDFDALHVITPYNIYGKGTILATDWNCEDTQWMIIDRFNAPNTVNFPTQSEIQSMADTLTSRVKDIIHELNCSEWVESVRVRSGFVLNEEY